MTAPTTHICDDAFECECDGSDATWTEEDSIRLDVDLVAVDGHRIRLDGESRARAARRMSSMGMTSTQAAERLRLRAHNVLQLARFPHNRSDAHAITYHAAQRILRMPAGAMTGAWTR